MKWMLLLLSSALCAENKPFAIVICSRNNEAYCRQNIRSALDQKYDNFHIYFVDDASTDRTLEIVKQEANDRVTIIENKEKKGALANQYQVIHAYLDKEIVVILDGDDALAHSYVLRLNEVYAKDIWLTYGQYREMHSGRLGFCCDVPERVAKRNEYRYWKHFFSHLRSYYAWLFKRIRKEDLFYKGSFYPIAADVAAMLPMIEMAKNHHVCIPEVLYFYNDDNPESHYKKGFDKGLACHTAVCLQQPYTPLDETPKRRHILIPTCALERAARKILNNCFAADSRRELRKR